MEQPSEKNRKKAGTASRRTRRHLPRCRRVSRLAAQKYAAGRKAKKAAPAKAAPKQDARRKGGRKKKG